MDRDVLIGGSVAAAVVAIALAVVIFVFVRRQWSHSEERKLRLRAKLSGLAFDDDEVCSRDTIRHATLILSLTLCGLTSQKTNQGGLWLSGSVHEEAHPCLPNFV